MFDHRLEKIANANRSYWAERIIHQVAYANELSRLAGGVYDQMVSTAVESLVRQQEKDAAITRQTTESVESLLAPLSVQAKAYSMLFVAHAHIDMNWMWRWDETVAITLDTFRTMLDLMEEYPQFTFSQSQASVYRLVERYDPALLDAIRKRVQEGRWEVTAVTWVEADKNMPNGESMARHLLYTRRYLKELFGLEDQAFGMDFEPDTFGHSRNVPEILADAGVRYYYHCRGDQRGLLYRWQAPSGRSIVVYREPLWYLGYIDPGLGLYAPAFCNQHGMGTMLKVYGVGDHGGGPTRRDLTRLMDMDQWSIYPRCRFGTFAEFFSEVEQVAESLPVETEELNFIFTGCYSSQSRIKRANRLGESALHAAETLSALAAVSSGGGYPSKMFADAWKNVLFNQFHDIIPGSGTVDTREYALGLFQETLAVAGSQGVLAMRQLAGANRRGAPADTHQPGDMRRADISAGAGVGFGVASFRTTQVSRGQGLRRVFAVFNPSPWQRMGLAEITLWDWEGRIDRMSWSDLDGNALKHQSLDRAWQDYWGHRYLRVLAPVTVPACGFTCLILDESDRNLELEPFPLDWRTETPLDLKLENELLIARFDPVCCTLISLIDKASGEELVTSDRPAGFRYILEDDLRGMTAWTVGRYIKVVNLDENVRLLRLEQGDLRQELVYEVKYNDSHLTVSVSLDSGSRQLSYAVQCEWLEVGRKGKGVPQLNFHLPLAYTSPSYLYDVPFGVTERSPQHLDVPANSFACARRLKPEAGKAALMLVSQGSYGLRGVDDSLALTLLRSSYDPDPHPELGMHELRFTVCIAPAAFSDSQLVREAFEIQHPWSVLSTPDVPPQQVSLLSLSGLTLGFSAVKLLEEDPSGKSLLVRMYEVDGQGGEAVLRFIRPVQRAELVDVHERPVQDAPLPLVDGQVLTFFVDAYRVCSLKVTF
jgi:alpha-mannosidase